jgi:hypothetical protein
LALAVLAAGCGSRGGGLGLSANAAHFEARIAAGGATLRARGHSCSGLYGDWRVRLSVGGAVHGSGETAFTLEPAREAVAPLSFRIRAGVVTGRATGTLRVRADAGALATHGRVRVTSPFRTVTRFISQRIPVERGPIAECGLSS